MDVAAGYVVAGLSAVAGSIGFSVRTARWAGRLETRVDGSERASTELKGDLRELKGDIRHMRERLDELVDMLAMGAHR